MSDIGMPSGLAMLLIAMATMAFGGVAAVVALVAGISSSLKPLESRGARIMRFTAGPLTCTAVGGIFLAWAGNSPGPSGDMLDDNWWTCPVIAIAAGIVLAVWLHRRAAGALST